MSRTPLATAKSWPQILRDPHPVPECDVQTTDGGATYTCTRKPSHAGDHVAHGPQDIIEYQWGDDHV